MICSDFYARTAAEAGDDLYGIYWYENFFLIASNLFLFFPFFKAVRLARYTRAFMYIGAMLASIAYHACKTADGLACITYFCLLRNYDFFFSILVLTTTALYLVPFAEESFLWLEDWAIYIYAVSITVFVTQDDDSYTLFLWWTISLTASSFVVVAAMLVILRLKFGPLPRLDWKDLIIAVVFAIAGVSLFVTEDDMGRTFYWISHSLWHTFASFASFYFLEVRDTEQWGWRSIVAICSPKKRKIGFGMR